VFQWLTGLDEVNDHTLADFRVEKQKELDEPSGSGSAQQGRTAYPGTSDARRNENQRIGERWK
jgi:hypothetical protein